MKTTTREIPAAKLPDFEKWRPFAIETAVRYKPHSMEPEDAAGIGVEALAESLLTHDATRSNAGTWVKYRIRGKMRNARAAAVRSIQTVSLELRFEGDDENHTADIPAPEPDEYEQADDRGVLAFSFLGALPEKQSVAIRLRLGLTESGKEHTLDEIGERLGGLSKERARQLINAGLDTLKKRLQGAAAKS